LLRSGEISGAVSWAELLPEERERVLSAAPWYFTVTARNLAGKTSCKLRILLLHAPDALALRHSEVTYKCGEVRLGRAQQGRACSRCQ
jgi:hypothetical protein